MTPEYSWIEIRPAAVVLRIRVQPRTGQRRVVGIVDGRLKIRVTEAPVRGQANAAALRLVAKLAGVPSSAVTLSRGSATRDKAVSISTPNPQETARRLVVATGTAGVRIR